MKSNRVLASLAAIALVVGVIGAPSLLSPSRHSGVAFAQGDKKVAEKEATQQKDIPKKAAQKKTVQKDTPKSDPKRAEAAKKDPPKKEAPKTEVQKKEAQKQAPQKKDALKDEAKKKEVQKKEAPKAELQNKEAQKLAPQKDAPKKGTAPRDAAKQNPRDLLARTPFTSAEQALAAIPGIPDARVWGDSEQEFKRLLPTVTGPWLALSGGGADGAFGAGLLVGWTQSGNRPDFAVVTGASIGALIGPYAFLGSEFDVELTKNFTDITAADVFEDRPTAESFLDTWPLKRMIEKRVTRALLKAIAAEHAKGRRYLVTTTNLDAGRRVIWNMGAIAARGDDKALKLFRDVLQASSSIPGFFQPVAIDVEANGKKFQEMHLDGTITSPFFMVPESTGTSQDIRLPADQFYVIINSKLTSDFSMANRQVHAILGRTIGVALVTGLRAELMLVTASARQLGIGLNIAHVPQDFTEANRGLFDHVYMQALFRHGADEAMNGRVFQTIVPMPAKAQAPAKTQQSVEPPTAKEITTGAITPGPKDERTETRAEALPDTPQDPSATSRP